MARDCLDETCNVKLIRCHPFCFGKMMFAIQPFSVVQDLVEPNHDPHSHLHHHQTHHNLQTPTCQNHNALVEEITTKDFVPKAGEGEEGEVEKHEKPFPDHQQLPNHQHHPDPPTYPSTSHHHHHRSLCLQRQELGHCFQTKTE